MARLTLFIAVLVGLYLFLNPPVTVTADVPPFPSQVEVIAKPGVTPYEIQAVKRAMSFAAKILEEEAGLCLKHPVSVILTPDLTSYYQALMNDERLDADSAFYQASVSAGTTRDRHILLNCGAVPNYNDLIFIAAHELTHQYQFDQDGDWSRNNWIIEGMAEVVAVSVVGVNQGNRMSQVREYRSNWVAQLRKAAPVLPAITSLDHRKDWLEAFQQHYTTTYRYSAMAVFNLVDAKGMKALGDYVRLRNQGLKAEEAFEQAFGQTMPAFFRSQERWLKEQTDPGHYDIKAAAPITKCWYSLVEAGARLTGV